jgi:hypothetical protein
MDQHHCGENSVGGEGKKGESESESESEKDKRGYSVYTPFHPSHLQTRAALGLTQLERSFIKRKGLRREKGKNDGDGDGDGKEDEESLAGELARHPLRELAPRFANSGHSRLTELPFSLKDHPGPLALSNIRRDSHIYGILEGLLRDLVSNTGCPLAEQMSVSF